jgi:geranylgeranyl diphosphate synthase type I
MLRSAVESLVPELRGIAAYHLGWAEVDGTPSTASGGKAVRPALAVLSAEAVDASPAVALPGAVAVELVHNFSLLHDDVMDGDRERRHRPTAWAVWGIGPAIIVGDALLSLAQEMLLAMDTPPGRAAAAALAHATTEMIAGQANDLAFEAEAAVSLERCVTMEAAKTGALLACAASIGALLAEAPAASVAALFDYGLHLGLAFQAIDDLLGIWGDPARTGKPAASDLRQHKKTLPVTASLALAGERTDELADLLVGAATSEQVAARAAQVMEACGVRAWVAAEASRHLDTAVGALDRVDLATGPVAELTELASYVVEREY